jgi:hypothetical protein
MAQATSMSWLLQLSTGDTSYKLSLTATCMPCMVTAVVTSYYGVAWLLHLSTAKMSTACHGHCICQQQITDTI